MAKRAGRPAFVLICCLSLVAAWAWAESGMPRYQDPQASLAQPASAVATPTDAGQATAVALVAPALTAFVTTPTIPPAAPIVLPSATVAPASQDPTATAAPVESPAPADTPTEAAGASGSIGETTPPLTTALLQQVSAAEAGLQSGHLDAWIMLGAATQSAAQVRFALGAAGQEPRIAISTRYTSTIGSRINTQATEFTMIGDRAWQRAPGGAWQPAAAQERVADQLQTYLPHAQEAFDASFTQEDGAMLLRWLDVHRDSDVVLRIDPATGTPQEMQRTTRATGVTLRVVYTGWNTPVEITTPPDTGAAP